MLEIVVALAARLGLAGLLGASTMRGPPVLPPSPTTTVAAPGAGVPPIPQTAAHKVAAAVELSWTVPAQCPSAARVRSGIAELLGGAPDPAAAAEVRVHAHIAADAGAFRLDLRIETPSGRTTKTMTAATCEVLLDATALISAIAIDPSAVLDATEVAPSVAAEAAPPLEEPPGDVGPPVEGPVQPAPSRARDREPPQPKAATRVPLVRFSMQAFGGLDTSILPGVAGSVGGLAGIFGAHWRAEIGALTLLPRTALVVADAGARLRLVVASARGCWVPTLGPLEVPLCGGAEAGALRGDPVGGRVANGRPVTEPHVGITASGGLGWAPRPFVAFVARTQLVVPLVRPGFAIGAALAHRVPGATGRFFAGIEARFP